MPRFTATVARGLEEVLAAELAELGIPRPIPGRGNVSFEGHLGLGYRACLWSRIASRVLMVLGGGPAADARALYEGLVGIPWLDHLGPEATLAVDFVGGSEEIRHGQYGARVVKDAIVDHIRGVTGDRPSVDLARPDLRVNVFLDSYGPGVPQATVSIDLSGAALHLRGSGRVTGQAPLKETLAAGLLHLAGWPAHARAGRPLVDPMCGAGTFLTEAAGIALDRAPGLGRTAWGFEGWRGHDRALWERLVEEAAVRARVERPVRICGYDADPTVLGWASNNAAALGLDEVIRLARRPVAGLRPPIPLSGPAPRGLLITNPPYGVRLGEEEALVADYATLGDTLRQAFLGWEAWLITGSPTLAGALGLRPARRIPVWNGAIECRFLCIPISTSPPRGSPGWRQEQEEPWDSGKS